MKRIVIGIASLGFLSLIFVLNLSDLSPTAAEPTPTATPGWLCVNEFPIFTNPSSYEIAPAVSGRTVVWVDSSSWIWGYDLYTSTQFLISNNSSYQHHPDISGDIVVWESQRDGSLDIYGYNLSSATEFPICTNPSAQYKPAIYGDIVMWEDNRDYATNGYDIYGYDLSSETEFPICTNPSAQYKPAIYGDIVVWSDNRNGNYDIYGYNLSAAAEFPICTDPSSQSSPAVYGDIVVWYDQRNGNRDIYGYDFSTSTEFPICTNSSDQQYPAISGDIVVWYDKRHGNGSIYGYNLSAAYEFPICTNPSEQNSPDVSGNVVVWTDLRNGTLEIQNFDIYGATLHCSTFPPPTPTSTSTPTSTPTPTATATATPTATGTPQCCLIIGIGEGDGYICNPCDPPPGWGCFMCFPCGEEVYIFAMPGDGWVFDKWIGDVDTVDDRYSDFAFVTMNGNYTIEATFKPYIEPTPTATATATPTPTASATATCMVYTTGNLTGTEWWVYHIYYNSEQGTTNSVYHIMNVRENSMGTHTLEYDDCGQRNFDGEGSGFTQRLATTGATCPCRPTSVCRNPSGFSNIDWTGVFIDHSMAYSGTGDTSPRHRVAPYGFTGTMVPASVNREVIDMESGVKRNSAITLTDTYQLPRTFAMTANNGVSPTNVQMSWDYQTNPATTGDEPAGIDGYPFAVNSTTRQQWQFVYADNRYMGWSAPKPALYEKGHRWAVPTSIVGYDVDANCEAADVTTETFDVYEVRRNPRYYARCPVGGTDAGGFLPLQGGISYTTDQAVNAWYWWNDSVKNFVRLLDRDTYYGREDWGIKAWESRRTDVTVNEFSDSGTGFDINVTVTNNCQTGAAGNFSVLALIMDMDAVTATNSVPYVNGKTIYPDVSSWSNIADAIQDTGTLAYGESATLIWNNVGSSSTTNTYKLWVNGGTATINEPVPTPTPTPTATPSATPTQSTTPTPTPTASATATATPTSTATPTATATATGTASSTPTATATPTPLPGDATGDGGIDAADITKVERIILALDEETPGADANGDGEVDAADIGVIEYMILEIWPWNHVHVEAPDNLPGGTDFTATAFVTYVEGLSSAALVVTYNAAVLDLLGVTGGRLLEIDPGVSAEMHTVAIDDWSQPGGAGTLLVNASVGGGVDGAGYLAQVQFHVSGSAGQTSPIAFNVSQSWLRDALGDAIDATWAGDSVTVAP